MESQREALKTKTLQARAGPTECGVNLPGCHIHLLQLRGPVTRSLAISPREAATELSCRADVVVARPTGCLVSVPARDYPHFPVMINLLHAGAVPFGYTSDKLESEFPSIEDCVSTGMSCHYLPDVRGE